MKKIPLQENMKAKCRALQQVYVDERMVKSKARTKFQQHMKDKPSKWQFKYWLISDPSMYSYDFNLYLGPA